MKRIFAVLAGILLGQLGFGQDGGIVEGPLRKRQVEVDRVSLEFPCPDSCIVRVKTDKSYVLFPVQEPEQFNRRTDGSTMKMVVEDQLQEKFWIFPAVDKINYHVTIDVSKFKKKEIIFLICTNDKNQSKGKIEEYIAWDNIGFIDKIVNPQQ